MCVKQNPVVVAGLHSPVTIAQSLAVHIGEALLLVQWLINEPGLIVHYDLTHVKEGGVVSHAPLVTVGAQCTIRDTCKCVRMCAWVSLG